MQVTYVVDATLLSYSYLGFQNLLNPKDSRKILNLAKTQQDEIAAQDGSMSNEGSDDDAELPNEELGK